MGPLCDENDTQTKGGTLCDKINVGTLCDENDSQTKGGTLCNKTDGQTKDSLVDHLQLDLPSLQHILPSQRPFILSR